MIQGMSVPSVVVRAHLPCMYVGIGYRNYPVFPFYYLYYHLYVVTKEQNAIAARIRLNRCRIMHRHIRSLFSGFPDGWRIIHIFTVLESLAKIMTSILGPRA